MGYIFISYSHKDRDYVHRLQDALQTEGFEVWIDDRIDYGDEWPMVIQDRLDGCDAFIVVATENSYKSNGFKKKSHVRRRINKPFFPLLLSGNPWLFIDSTQYVDVKDKSLPPERFYKRLSSVTSRNKPIPPLSREETKLRKPVTKLAIEKKKAHVKEAAPKFDFGLLGIAGVVLFVLILVFGVNYLAHMSTTPQPTLGIVSTMISPKDGMNLLYVPAGNFLMGSAIQTLHMAMKNHNILFT